MTTNENTIRYFSTNDQNVFFTSDTHFGHTNIIKYCNRPFSSTEEMDEVLITNWNNAVKPNDVVFHLGDFCFDGSQRIKELLDRLNGKIYLIVGNHDWKTIKDGSANKFTGIYQQMSIMVNGRKIYMNHYPFLCYAGTYYKGDKVVWQLFGHVHSSPNKTNNLDDNRLSNLFPMQYDVGVDNNNYTPVSFNKVNEIINKQIMSSDMFKTEQ